MNQHVCRKHVFDLAPNALFRLTYQVVEHALVQRSLELPALPELLVVVVEALPVLAELCQAVLVHVVQSVLPSQKQLLPAQEFRQQFSCILLKPPGVRTRWLRIL
jgi:hypothetical protein